MNRSVTVAILVSVLGFCVIVAICFLTYKLNPRHAELEPDDSSLDLQPNQPSPSFGPPSTRRFVIRGGQAISASQTGTPSIRSGFSWNHRRNGLHSERQSNADLRQVGEQARPRPPRKDVEKGIVDAVVESTVFMPERSSIATPSVLAHQRALSVVPEMSQMSPNRSLQARTLSWDVRQLLDEVRTETPIGHSIQQAKSSAPFVTARQSQIYELPATPVPPQSPEMEAQASNTQDDISSTSHTLMEPTMPTSSRALSTLMSSSHPITPTSALTPTQPTATASPSSPTTSTPGRLSMDDASRALLRSKYNVSSSAK